MEKIKKNKTHVAGLHLDIPADTTIELANGIILRNKSQKYAIKIVIDTKNLIKPTKAVKNGNETEK